MGGPVPDGKPGIASVKFGVIVRDDRCANICKYFWFLILYLYVYLPPLCYPVDPVEALVGTLRAAKKRKDITYEGQLSLLGVHDDVDIVLLQDSTE